MHPVTATYMPDRGRSDAVATPADALNVSVADVLAAQARLRRFLPPTPLHYAERFGTWLKLENLQRTGSYKVRGALNAMLAALERGDERPDLGLVARRPDGVPRDAEHEQHRHDAEVRRHLPEKIPKGEPPAL